MWSRMQGRYALVGALAAVAAAVGIASAQGAQTDSWSMSGQGITNWRYQPGENKINANNIKKLSLKWATQLGGEISATPAVVDGVAYVPDWGGKLSAVDTETGSIIWQKSVAALAGAVAPMKVDGSGNTVVDTGGLVMSRTSPAVSGNTVVIGTQTSTPTASGAGAGAVLIAVNKTNGNLLWHTRLDDHPLSIDSQSPTIYDGKIYVGVASVEEEDGIDCGGPDVGGHHACYFRGSMGAVDLATGLVNWKTLHDHPCTGRRPGIPGQPIGGRLRRST